MRIIVARLLDASDDTHECNGSQHDMIGTNNHLPDDAHETHHNCYPYL
jgi:hypothetical protein